MVGLPECRARKTGHLVATFECSSLKACEVYSSKAIAIDYCRKTGSVVVRDPHYKKYVSYIVPTHFECSQHFWLWSFFNHENHRLAVCMN